MVLSDGAKQIILPELPLIQEQHFPRVSSEVHTN